MCGLCGSLSGRNWTEGVAPDGQSEPAPLRRAARRARAAAANRVLACAGLTVADWQGAAFQLRARTGATAMVAGMLDLWAAADRLGPALDPLDPVLLARIERAQSEQGGSGRAGFGRAEPERS